MIPLLHNALNRGIVPSLSVTVRRFSSLIRTGYLHTSERVCPEFRDEIFENHLKVYKFLVQLVENKDILEVGCGTGYGTFLLAERAISVSAIDYSSQAIRYAYRNYHAENISYSVMKAEKLQFASDSFDVALSSEVFEHLRDQRGHLREVSRVLRPNGLCFIATPNPEISQGQNKFHTKENSLPEMACLLSEFFADVQIIETLLDPPTEQKQKDKQSRIALGYRGLDPRSELDLFGIRIDKTFLHNTHSFFCFAKGKRPKNSCG